MTEQTESLELNDFVSHGAANYMKLQQAMKVLTTALADTCESILASREAKLREALGCATLPQTYDTSEEWDTVTNIGRAIDINISDDSTVTFSVYLFWSLDQRDGRPCAEVALEVPEEKFEIVAKRLSAAADIKAEESELIFWGHTPLESVTPEEMRQALEKLLDRWIEILTEVGGLDGLLVVGERRKA